MEPYRDTPRHGELRRRLANGIREKGITDERVLEAIFSVPRHYFMSGDLEGMAYEDRPLPIGEGQTISQPYTVAYQTQLLGVEPGCRVLEIGTGSAYQATVLAYMGAEVFTIERQKKLYQKLQQFEYLKTFPNIHLFYGDGYEGLPELAPFHRILITAAAPEVPVGLLQQLQKGGCLVLPLGSGKPQRMVRITLTESGEPEEEYFDHFSFVPMLKGKQE